MDPGPHGKSTGPVEPWPHFVLPKFHPSSTKHGTPAKPSGLAHFGRYSGTPADVAYGDSLAASARAAKEGWWGIDKNMLCTARQRADHQPLHGAVHPPRRRVHASLDRPRWGEGDRILDPKRALSVGGREWSDIALVTDVTGTRRILTLESHVADGVARNLVQMPEAKSQAVMGRAPVWATAGEMMDRHGHPRVMMTLSEYGSPLARCKAAKANGFQTVILPRGKKPANFDTTWKPYVDRLWGPAWGTL